MLLEEVCYFHLPVLLVYLGFSRMYVEVSTSLSMCVSVRQIYRYGILRMLFLSEVIEDNWKFLNILGPY